MVCRLGVEPVATAPGGRCLVKHRAQARYRISKLRFGVGDRVRVRRGARVGFFGVRVGVGCKFMVD